MTVQEYRSRAEECVKLAQTARASDRPALLEIAAAWLTLAAEEERETKLLNGGRPQEAKPA